MSSSSYDTHDKALPVVIMGNKDSEEMRKLVVEGLGDLKLDVQVR